MAVLVHCYVKTTQIKQNNHITWLVGRKNKMSALPQSLEKQTLCFFRRSEACAKVLLGKEHECNQLVEKVCTTPNSHTILSSTESIFTFVICVLSVVTTSSSLASHFRVMKCSRCSLIAVKFKWHMLLSRNCCDYLVPSEMLVFNSTVLNSTCCGFSLKLYRAIEFCDCLFCKDLMTVSCYHSSG